MKAVKTLLAVVAFSAVASANTVTFVTTAGAQSQGLPISASATITTGANGLITVALSDLLANPTSVTQLVSDLFFTINVSSALSTTTTPTASLINIAANGTSSASGDAVASWGLSSSGFVIHLDSLVGGPSQTIIGPGPYTNANGSIAGNGPHNPFINGTANFSFNVTGVTAATTITAATFSFGTVSGENITGCIQGSTQCTSTNLPEPISSALVGTGLVSLFFLRRRASKKA